MTSGNLCWLTLWNIWHICRTQNFECKYILRYNDMLLQLLRTEWQKMFEHLLNNSNFRFSIMLRIASLWALFDWFRPIYIPDFHGIEVWHHEIKAFYNSSCAVSAVYVYGIFFLVLRSLFPFFPVKLRLATVYTQKCREP